MPSACSALLRRGLLLVGLLACLLSVVLSAELEFFAVRVIAGSPDSPTVKLFSDPDFFLSEPLILPAEGDTAAALASKTTAEKADGSAPNSAPVGAATGFRIEFATAAGRGNPIPVTYNAVHFALVSEDPNIKSLSRAEADHMPVLADIALAGHLESVRGTQVFVVEMSLEQASKFFLGRDGLYKFTIMAGGSSPKLDVPQLIRRPLGLMRMRFSAIEKPGTSAKAPALPHVSHLPRHGSELRGTDDRLAFPAAPTPATVCAPAWASTGAALGTLGLGGIFLLVVLSQAALSTKGMTTWSVLLAAMLPATFLYDAWVWWAGAHGARILPTLPTRLALTLATIWVARRGVARVCA
ncbi:hypothetical protein H696_00699 [Fonticula alba]|uniref:Dolichyl-diphosphooligosaccharide--protein glycosyltransferase subunit 2 n=1 Tax=Fonticula alba TaxID=691883 RepID=A0A058ZGU1_FONAL|nr:hypothetical protein H696_00699 [Fonticula alba]KCV73153.1 hypothetical protein H696_00699 [Fonticula alba]|eukprot:XP_009492854.1 hypothetical protein H696_00699 [Fonticula alba]